MSPIQTQKCFFCYVYVITSCLIISLGLLPQAYALYERLHGILNIQEIFYLNSTEGLSSVKFIVPLKEHYSKIEILQCINATCRYNSTHLVIEADINKLKVGYNSITSLLNISQGVILPYKRDANENIEKYMLSTDNIQTEIPALVNISSSIKQYCDRETSNKVLCYIKESMEFVNSFLEYDEKYSDKNYNTSWILQTKRGVCAEYTTLFISILRNLQIPARYVSSFSYSTEEKKIIPHAYAEVYLADKNEWYPVDVLWKEAGYVDALHITRASTASNYVKSNVEITYLSSNYPLNFQWINENISFQEVQLKDNKSFFSIEVKENSTSHIVLHLVSPREGICTGIKINPCIGGNVSTIPEEAIMCDKLRVEIRGIKKGSICPIIVQYDTTYATIEIKAPYPTFWEYILSLIRKAYMFFTSLLKDI